MQDVMNNELYADLMAAGATPEIAAAVARHVPSVPVTQTDLQLLEIRLRQQCMSSSEKETSHRRKRSLTWQQILLIAVLGGLALPILVSLAVLLEGLLS